MVRAAIRRVAPRVTASATLAAAAGWLWRAMRGVPGALGASSAVIRAVAAGSTNFRDGAFANIDPAASVRFDGEQLRLVSWEIINGRAASRPRAPIPLAGPTAVAPPSRSLLVSWYGHSTVLLEIDGYRVLTDPVWSNRCSPSGLIGPQRLHPVPRQLETLPAVDAVVISHDHYDHLDVETIIALARLQRAQFFVPLGVGAHLRQWGIAEQRIVELDWYQQARVDELTLTCTPARHFSGRFLDRNVTLWASWVLAGPKHRVYFAGDTGYTKTFARIGAEYGPFELTLMPIGGYNAAWQDLHMTPEEAVRAHLDITSSPSGVLVPIHWCTFRLAPHPWAEPIDRHLVAADAARVRVATPLPGKQIDPVQPPEPDLWWRSLSGG
ncbi:MAG: MBL fold metallo-hydrolase [Mycobacteriaceae bacterium]|nr:MBL fold metallo-hydrolase [Mycobacteriaceae bacterium]